jgi:hypothetical protein
LTLASFGWRWSGKGIMLATCGDVVMETRQVFQPAIGGSIPTSSLQNYWIEPISYSLAMDIVVEKHYLHRKCPVSFAFGLFNYSSLMPVGVVTYGVSPSSTLLKGICGESEKFNVYELNRLWVDDSIPKNGESYLIGRTIKRLDREIIVSYADSSQAHIGVVYQATNFIYTGLSAKFLDPKVKGLENQHHATYANGLTNKQVIEKFGKDNVYFKERSRKHRYIYFNARGKRKLELLDKLRYRVLPYPKEVTE